MHVCSPKKLSFCPKESLLHKHNRSIISILCNWARCAEGTTNKDTTPSPWPPLPTHSKDCLPERRTSSLILHTWPNQPSLAWPDWCGQRSPSVEIHSSFCTNILGLFVLIWMQFSLWISKWLLEFECQKFWKSMNFSSIICTWHPHGWS